MPRALLTFLLAAGVCLGGCGRGQAPAPVRVLAAASTADAVRDVAAAFTAKSGIDVEVSAAGSNALANQILAGAPADVFLSAGTEWAGAVEKSGLAVASRPLLTNEIVLVTRLGAAGVASPADLRGDTVRRVALAGEAVPAGVYAEQSLRAAGLYEALVSSDRVARGDDVRQALFYVETGEAEAGIVYATDAAASDKVKVVYTFPAETHEPIVYPAVLLKCEGDGGQRFYDFLGGEVAAAIFRKHGFVPAAGGA